MKKKILLLDESITVQKVVSLTLDKNVYDVTCAKSVSEAKLSFQQHPIDLILVSDQTTGVRAPDFPNEVASWVRPAPAPPLVLITTAELNEMRGYAGVLKKPFSPRALQTIVADQTAEKKTLSPADAKKEIQESVDEFEAQRLETLFNSKFADESQLVRETFGQMNAKAPVPNPPGSAPHLRPVPTPQETAPPPLPDLWAPTPNPPPPSRPLWGTSPAPRQAPPNLSFDPAQLEDKINRVLNEILPPIVERLVKERLDTLLTEARKTPPSAGGSLQRSR